MNQATENYDGGCLCGAIRYKLSGPPESSTHCHCRSCQRALGGAFATWCSAKRDNFEVIKGTIKVCETSPGVLRGFCGNCGTSLSYATKEDASGRVWFLGSTLDDPSTLAPTSHVYVSHQQPWVKINDGLPMSKEF